VHFKRSVRLRAVKEVFGNDGHWELSRSSAAEAYVWKAESSVPDTRFEYGVKPIRRGVGTDWDAVRNMAKDGRLEDIPGDIFIRCYNQLKRIAADYCQPLAVEREVVVYWGSTGSGKSRRAWEEATLEAYPKDPRSKFWDGYRSQTNVVIDEFRGGIDISHVLRWFDRYPVIVEVKGSATVLKATKIWITSNLHPDLWYPEIDMETKDALKRRLTIINI